MSNTMKHAPLRDPRPPEVGMYVRMYVCMYVCMYARVYVCAGP